MKTMWFSLTQDVHFRRDEDAIEVFVTGDLAPPRVDEANLLTKSRLTVEQFANIIGSVNLAKGALVNVGTPSIPLLVPQSQAGLYTALIVRGGADGAADMVNVGDENNALLLSPKDAEAYGVLLVEAIHEQVQKALAEERAVKAQEAADLEKRLNASAVNVGRDFGLPLLLQPGDAEKFTQIVEMKIQNALDKARAEA